MPYDPNDPNQDSQGGESPFGRAQSEGEYQYDSFAHLLAQDPDVQHFVAAHGGQLDGSATSQLIQLVHQKYPNNGPAGWTLDSHGGVTESNNTIPTWVKALAIEMAASFAIPVIAGAVGGSGAAGAAYGPTLEQLGATPEEIGLATSGAAGIADVGTFAGGIGSTGAADAGTTAAVGTGAADAGTTAIADVGTPGFVGTSVAGTEAPITAAGNVAALSTPEAAGISAPALATTPGVTAAAAPSVGAGGTAAVASPSLWDKVGRVASNPAVTTGIGAATTLIGAKMGADANRDASQAQLQAAREALDWEKSVYGQRQQQLAPTINIGNAAREQLATLMGIQPNTPSNGWNYVTPQSAPNAVANPKWTTQSPTAPAGMVTMTSPDGKQGYVPMHNVQAALNAGGRLA